MRDPEASLMDVVTYSRRAVDYLDGVSAQEFALDTGVQDQVIRCLTVIGEAARCRSVQPERAQHPDVGRAANGHLVARPSRCALSAALPMSDRRCRVVLPSVLL